ncbi:maleylacetoacetate isomerase [Coralloluteibacterium stylophorae]|uniref:Maleylacetoacetate isomerase n=1 Tax=Coralloluteibacterium stylophorae TaxID=1776034 RepID=A0A8J7VVC1_9GAMM|nr:maleylacetoacetate isomerase [Coralloluteibacterium stylophorae]MBS7457844.1 maleylacetoacetate isomerase [Coralloluteibacterium stylophorae]
MTLYSYWRSSAAYRVRIALNLKGLEYAIEPVHLVRDGGQQHAPAYRGINPQGVVPTLLHGERVFRQSLAIIEYIDETWPAPPLLPARSRDRARVRALAQLVASDMHPLNNLRVLQFLEGEWSVPQAERELWIRHWLLEGFAALEALLADHPSTGRFCDGEAPGLADCCLVPQVYNARRFGVDLAPFPNVARIEANCMALPEFAAARPEAQPDAPAA